MVKLLSPCPDLIISWALLSFGIYSVYAYTLWFKPVLCCARECFNGVRGIYDNICSLVHNHWVNIFILWLTCNIAATVLASSDLEISHWVPLAYEHLIGLNRAWCCRVALLKSLVVLVLRKVNSCSELFVCSSWFPLSVDHGLILRRF